jgi:hypothetical protein
MYTAAQEELRTHPHLPSSTNLCWATNQHNQHLAAQNVASPPLFLPDTTTATLLLLLSLRLKNHNKTVIYLFPFMFKVYFPECYMAFVLVNDDNEEE